MSSRPFFIGWAKPPKELRFFLVMVMVVCPVVFFIAAYVAAATQNDPGSAAFRFDWGPLTLKGVLQAEPYPVLHVIEGERGTAGQSIMLSGVGKRGVMERASGLDGALVEATGIMLTRGNLLMMQVRANETGLVAVEDSAPADPPGSEDLGTWQLTGEICDGKCYAGAMRPGTGLAHKACANLCIAGGTPPVFVATGAVDGASFFLMGDEDGKPLDIDTVKTWSALRVTLSGTITRTGTMPILATDLSTVELAR